MLAVVGEDSEASLCCNSNKKIAALVVIDHYQVQIIVLFYLPYCVCTSKIVFLLL